MTSAAVNPGEGDVVRLIRSAPAVPHGTPEPEYDRYGNPIPAPTAPPGAPAALVVDLPVIHVGPAPAATLEGFGVAFDQVADHWQMWCYPGTVLTTDDRVEAAGMTFEIMGTPTPVLDSEGQTDHVKAWLVRYGG